ncbi:hypothetical protein GCM10022254_01100 [Actinomadura meridiana]|uniref:Polyketide cyclase / dehydrase and lipid transport n=1 Tax=Actinomadura meridiana TaxID=559626 RepID=A0ABP8BRZ0_9ACTN
MTWPVGELDDVGRLRAVAASFPGVLLEEAVLPSPFEDVWAVLGDPERGFAGLLPDVRSVRVTERRGERMRVMVRGRSGLRAPFDMVLRPGWCLMQSRFLVFGMGVVPEGDVTRFAYMAALRVPGARVLGPPVRRVLGPLFLRRFVRRFTPGE